MPILTRRDFIKLALVEAAGLGLFASRAPAAETADGGFSFVVLGDLHFDALAHHDLEWLQREKPDDLRQAREYSSLTANILPRLFATVGETIADLNRSALNPVAFSLQLGDVVEGLCGREELALRQDSAFLTFLRAAKVGVPFLFTKGNHDITGAGALEAFNNVFPPFLREQLSALRVEPKLEGARYSLEHNQALFCFFDAYDKESLGWLEAVLARRTARHCFVIVHPPIVPYGARSTWHLFAGERDRARREHLLELLGRHNAFVLSGHIHKYNVLVRAVPRGGRFLQIGLSSVIPSADIKPQHLLSGVDSYNPEQVKVEPAFSPATEKERREVYTTEAPFIRCFEYADLPGYAVITVNGPQVTACFYSGITRQLWRTRNLSELLVA